MHQVGLIRPQYAESFHCIGSSCEDTCCEGWGVPVQREDFERFLTLPDGALRTKVLAAVEIAPKNGEQAEGFGKNPFARLVMNQSNRCPLLTPDKLCRVHAECGSEYLAHTCATYPRIVRTCGGLEERALALSCPEAARHVLLNPKLEVFSAGHSEARRNRPRHGELPAHFWLIRETMVALVRNRAYPLWKRLFLMGVLCRRLDEIAAGLIDRDVPVFLADFQATVDSGILNAAMEAEPLDRKAQLDAVLRLAGLMLTRSNVRPRFVECIQAFAQGIGNGPSATLDTLTECYTEAHDQYFSPFFEHRQHILENWLLNTIFRTGFPYGTEGIGEGGAVSMAREFARLGAQFALIKGLLIGVAGCYRQQFSVEHVIHTVQAASKHFDHHPEFPKFAHELLTELGLDGARGLSVLLRNAEPIVSRLPVPGKAVPALLAGKALDLPSAAGMN